MEPLANSRMVSVVVVSTLASISVPVVVGMRAEVEIEAEASEGSHSPDLTDLTLQETLLAAFTESQRKTHVRPS